MSTPTDAELYLAYNPKADVTAMSPQHIEGLRRVAELVATQYANINVLPKNEIVYQAINGIMLDNEMTVDEYEEHINNMSSSDFRKYYGNSSIPEAFEYLRAHRAEFEYVEDTRRAPVQASSGHPAGTIAWTEHQAAWEAYNKRYHGQSAERIAERGGFGWSEVCHFLGHEPTTFEVK